MGYGAISKNTGKPKGGRAVSGYKSFGKRVKSAAPKKSFQKSYPTSHPKGVHKG